MRLGFDIEANGLLDSTTIDYKAVPYKLKPMFRVWCAAAIDIDTGITYKFVGEEEIRDGLINLLRRATLIFGHNIIDYDLLVLRLYTGVEYTIGDTCTFDGKPVDIVDTLVLSKTLNPDRYGGHSLDEWGQRLGLEKINWRQRAIELGLIAYNAPKGAEFQQYHPEMLEYNVRDVQVNVKLYHALMEEWGDWPWDDAFKLEMRTRDIVTRQSHRGFWFDRKLAERNIAELDELMEGIRQVVEPHLPPKLLGITKAKAFMPPKIQFKKNGEISAVMLKFIEKHDGVYTEVDGKYAATFYGESKVWALPMDTEVPIRSHEPATVKDTTHIKGWLVEMGWRPTMYKERDLTCDAKKKKLSREKFEEVVERYVEQTLESPFCRDRCEELNTRPSRLREKLLKHDIKRPLKVYTNPTFTVGMEKEIDPELEKLAETFPHVGLISKYLTYAHRRNSILGGGFDPDDIDEDDEFAGKGFLAAERILEDGRIPTPADSCGAATSRMKHRVVVNVPRVSSLFGTEMRGMFGVNPSEPVVQMGYDFASLEAMIEAHYCWKYDGEDKAYCRSLTMEKPNDVHTRTAEKVAEMVTAATGLDFKFSRTQAKPVKYACAYGASPERVAKTVGCDASTGKLIHEAYWDAAAPLAELKDKLKAYWETTGGKKFILGLDGRKVPTRSASALINSLFQSAGVICAKRAMVFHEEKLKKLGLIVDFFGEVPGERGYCQQLIAMHDEAQMEVSKSLVKWKVFASEEEARAFKAENKGWSEIGHSAKGYFVGQCLPGTTIQEAVSEASHYYKLNVLLSADYILGRNWAECH